MSNSLRTVKMRMLATKKTSQITKAMNMVSASKLRKAERVFRDYQCFIDQIESIVKSIVDAEGTIKHPMLLKKEVHKIGYIIITSDRGLAGPYNSTVYKKLALDIDEKKLKLDDFVVSTIGTRGFGYCKKAGYKMIQKEPVYVRDDVAFIDVVEYVNKMISLYVNGDIDCIRVIYNHYVNTITQDVQVVDILPISNEIKGSSTVEYEYDQGKEKSLDLILPMYVENAFFGLILDAKASEHASRMNAMRSATDNASAVIEALRLIYNRTRQSAITSELTDIIGGTNAVE